MSVASIMYDALKTINDMAVPDDKAENKSKKEYASLLIKMLRQAIDEADTALLKVKKTILSEGERRHGLVEPHMSDETQPAEADLARGPRVGGLFRDEG